jgi:hypothetical protein
MMDGLDEAFSAGRRIDLPFPHHLDPAIIMAIAGDHPLSIHPMLFQPFSQHSFFASSASLKFIQRLYVSHRDLQSYCSHRVTLMGYCHSYRFIFRPPRQLDRRSFLYNSLFDHT